MINHIRTNNHHNHQIQVGLLGHNLPIFLSTETIVPLPSSSKDAKANVVATPAEGPSFGMAPWIQAKTVGSNIPNSTIPEENKHLFANILQTIAKNHKKKSNIIGCQHFEIDKILMFCCVLTHQTWHGYRQSSPRPAGKCTWMSSPPKGSCILCSFLTNWDKMSSEPLSLRWRRVMDLIHQDASRNGEALEIKYAI